MTKSPGYGRLEQGMSELSDLVRWSRRRLLKSVPALLAASAVPAGASHGAESGDAVSPVVTDPDSKSPGRRRLLNPDWRFYLGDAEGAEAIRFDDHQWQTVNLPHSFGVPYFARPGFYVGYGWYRKDLVLDEISPGRRITIEFEAAFQDAEIFVNGKRAGQHLGGYTGFSL